MNVKPNIYAATLRCFAQSFSGVHLSIVSDAATEIDRLEAENSQLRSQLGANPIVGELVTAGDIQLEGGEIITGLLICMTRDQLRAVETLPMYRRVSVREIAKEQK